MHGIDDKVVPCSSGKALYESLMKERARRIKEKESCGKKERSSCGTDRLTFLPKWIPSVGHNDMPETDCLNDVAMFLQFLEEQQ